MKKILIYIVLMVVVLGGAYYFLGKSVPAPSGNTAPIDAPKDANYKISSTNSSIEFSIWETLRGKEFLAKGITSDISGDFVLSSTDAVESKIGTIRINARTFKTDSTQRDGAIAKFILKSDKPENEFIEFKTSGIARVDALNYKVSGKLTISGITKDATFDVALSNDVTGVNATANTTLKRSDFGLTIPNIPFVANVHDEFDIKVNISADKI